MQEFVCDYCTNSIVDSRHIKFTGAKPWKKGYTPEEEYVNLDFCCATCFNNWYNDVPRPLLQPIVMQ